MRSLGADLEESSAVIQPAGSVWWEGGVGCYWSRDPGMRRQLRVQDHGSDEEHVEVVLSTYAGLRDPGGAWGLTLFGVAALLVLIVAVVDPGLLA